MLGGLSPQAEEPSLPERSALEETGRCSSSSPTLEWEVSEDLGVWRGSDPEDEVILSQRTWSTPPE